MRGVEAVKGRLGLMAAVKMLRGEPDARVERMGLHRHKSFGSLRMQHATDTAELARAELARMEHDGTAGTATAAATAAAARLAKAGARPAPEEWVRDVLRSCISQGWATTKPEAEEQWHAGGGGGGGGGDGDGDAGMMHGKKLPLLRLTPLGRKMLAGNAPMLMVLPPPPPGISRPTRRPPTAARTRAAATVGGSSGRNDWGGAGAESGLVARLKEWRTRAAQAGQKKAHQVLTNKNIDAIAAARPQSAEELGRVKGMGPVRMEKYAEAILAVVAGAARE
jgi:superfamily II DNA helicase RecQ